LATEFGQKVFDNSIHKHRIDQGHQLMLPFIEANSLVPERQNKREQKLISRNLLKLQKK
jgi:hypothetical protein